MQSTKEQTSLPPPSQKWRVGCNIDVRDPYGKKVSPDYCWVLGGDYRDQFPTTLTMVSGTIFIVDDSGVRLEPQRKLSSLCDRTPKRMAVDGERIDLLSNRDQVARALGGSVFTREQARPWPYCNLVHYSVKVDGLSVALEEAKALWAKQRPSRAI